MSFPLLSEAFGRDLEFESAAATSDGGLAVLFSRSPVDGDAEVTDFIAAIFERTADGGLEQVGGDIAVSRIDSEFSRSGVVVAGAEGGFLVVISSAIGEGAERTPIKTVIGYDSLGVQTGVVESEFAGSLFFGAPAPLPTGSGAPDWLWHDPFTGQMIRLTTATGTFETVHVAGRVSPATALADGTLVEAPLAASETDFAQPWTMESVSGEAVSFLFPGLDSTSAPTVFASGNVLAAQQGSADARRVTLTVAKPGDERDVGVAEIEFAEGTTGFSRVVPIEGVGFMVTGFALPAFGSGRRGPIEVALVDYDGDVIATSRFARIVDEDAGEIVALSLAREAGEPLRIAFLQEVTTFLDGDFRDLSQGEVVDLSPRIDVTGTLRDDLLLGFDKDDEIRGGAGSDSVEAGAGDDLVIGGAGNDRIEAGEGTDSVDGGSGRDRIAGGGGRDDIDGGKGADLIEGGGARDFILGGDDADEIRGDGGGDLVGGGAGDDAILGGAGKDQLSGEGGDDAIFGEGGADEIVGGFGADALFGGGGRDRFVYEAPSDSRRALVDEIGDFSRAERDRIDLKAIDARAGSPRDDAFRFIGEAAFGGRKGQLRAEAEGDGVIRVEADVDGDGRADFELRVVLASGDALGAGDFIL